MTVFSDDFERANGAPGNGWTDVRSTSAITGGALTGTNHFASLNTNTYDTTYRDAIAVVSGTASGTVRPGVVQCMDVGNLTGLMLSITGSSRPYTLQLVNATLYSATQVATASLDVNLPPMYTLRLTWDNGHVVGSYNGTVYIELDTALYFNQRYAGVYGYSTTVVIQSFNCTMGAAATFAVSPNPVGNYGACTELTLSGTGTSWTAGTPGSPTFTVANGTFSDQVVSSATSATVTYCPGNFLGTTTVTDPSTGLTAALIVTSDPAVVPPASECPFDEPFIELANRSGHNGSSDELLTTATPAPTGSPFGSGATFIDFMIEWARAQHGSDAGTLPDQGVLPLLWDLINDRNEPGVGPWAAPSGLPLAQHLDLLSTDMGNLTDERTTYLPEVITAIKGGDGPNLEQLELQIGIAGQAEYADLLAAIAAVKGDPLATVNAAIQQIFAIRTAANYDLQDVLDAIAAIGPGGSTDLTPVLHKLDHIQPDEFNTLSSLASAQAVEMAAIVALAVAFAKFITPAEFTVTSILDTITNGNQAIIDEIRKIKAPPHWPGHANVTFGAPHDLATTTLVEGPMHGVLIEITATEPGTSFMQYDGVKAWRHVGGLAFYTDDGQMETYQALGFATAVYVPKTMSIAQGCKLFKSHLPRGTITPWTISS